MLQLKREMTYRLPYIFKKNSKTKIAYSGCNILKTMKACTTNCPVTVSFIINGDRVTSPRLYSPIHASIFPSHHTAVENKVCLIKTFGEK